MQLLSTSDEALWPKLLDPLIKGNFGQGKPKLKRITKVKEQFPGEESLDMVFYCYSVEYNTKFGNRIKRGFKQAQFQIAQMFEKVYGTNTDNKELEFTNKNKSLEIDKVNRELFLSDLTQLMKTGNS